MFPWQLGVEDWKRSFGMSECHPQLLLIAFRGQRVGGHKWNSRGMMAVFIRPRSEGHRVQVWIKFWLIYLLIGCGLSFSSPGSLEMSTICLCVQQYPHRLIWIRISYFRRVSKCESPSFNSLMFSQLFRAWFTTYQAYVHTAAEYGCQSCFRALNTVRFTLGLVINRSDIAFNNPNWLH